MAATIVYGIPNCDTTKKALALLKKNNIPFSFHDYKLQGITKEKLEYWCSLKSWELIFNRRSTTWRELSESEQKKVIDQPSAIKLMMEQNSIIKRPVIEYNGKLIVGFNEKEIKGLFKI
jgi:arsenate reductase (glutaredoxin)